MATRTGRSIRDEATINTWSTPTGIEHRRARLMAKWKEAMTPGTPTYDRVANRVSTISRLSRGRHRKMHIGGPASRLAYVRYFVNAILGDGGEFTVHRLKAWLDENRPTMGDSVRALSGFLYMHRADLGIERHVSGGTFDKHQVTIWGARQDARFDTAGTRAMP